ncbi:interferon-induced very large GTPase 1 isoform X2 [Bombina bombina]|uniref:interferon-induced very large GTPase 1 isoform X2 n=1 Tax=Bombina bombina TaxID=8345 RepID=UPI00235AC69B|nr:interferon-induced very large GTPase 1 isoform X2 [Bombina bombina]
MNISWPWGFSFSEQSSRTKDLVLPPRDTRLIVGITSRCAEEKLKWLIDLLNSACFSGLVSEVRFVYISNRNFIEWKQEVKKCCVVILYHTVHHGGLNITDIDAALYNDELLYLSQSRGQGNVIVVVDDLEQTDDDKRQIILKNQPSIGRYSCELLLIPTKQKETAFLTKCRRLQPVQPRGPSQQSGTPSSKEDLGPTKSKQPKHSDSKQESLTSPERNFRIRPSLHKHRISIFSRAASSNYQWLVSQLMGPSFRNLLEKDVSCVYISNNYSQFLQKTSECTFAILYHTRKHGRINITDVTDSLYDKELGDLSQKLDHAPQKPPGKEKYPITTNKPEEQQRNKTPAAEGYGFRNQSPSELQCHEKSRQGHDNDPKGLHSHPLPRDESTDIPTYAALQDKKEIFDEMLLKMKMKAHRNNKLTLQESVKGMNSWSPGNPVLDYLYKLQLLDATARNPCMGLETYKTNLDMEPDASNVIHPLDILCVLLHCSDTLLQQYILSNMSMCQFSVPLLLPGVDGPDYTFMLWAMRDIVKRWIPQSLVASKGFTEDNLVQIQMPVFSFVRLGTCNISKSKVLNEVLSPAQQYHDFFTHRNMEGGNVPRQISSGLVEIFWYFPAGKDYLDVFTEPVAITNLRGDLESNLKQFHFLSQISSSVFIIAESITNDQYQLLHNIKDSKTKYFFIIAPTGGKMDTDTQEFLKQLLSPNRTNILVMNKASNEAALVKNIRSAIVKLGQNNSQNLSIENMVQIAEDFKIFIDENSEECQKAKEDARKITEKIQDVVEYKRETVKLQGDPWKELAKLEKEMCQMKRQGTNNGEEYEYRINQRCSEIRKQQYTIRGPNDITSFITAITNKSHVERWYFVKWMKFYLNLAARNKLSIQNQCNNERIYLTNKELAGLDQRISDGSLGVEHFMRELSQLYEAEYFTVKEKTDRNNSGLPGIAADLLLDGFPLELIDGDASNIPLQWVTDVLTELDNKTGGGCRLRVITVLGKQNTRTSALLNIIFGLQIPIPSGYCIHGAFMTLIKVKENIKGKLGFDFILVIDTKGLKTSRLDDRCEHENKLLTLAIGLSDITIINMDTENTDNIKNILQIVVQAFLRVKETGKKPRCQMVHQDVRDVFDHENNMRDRKKFLEQLNEMTRLAASIERKYDITAFSDIMEYDLEQHDWYIPGLWHGSPPMAPVSSGYSKKICELKRNLFQFLKKSSKKAQTIPEFVKWISSFWNSLKDERFIFSFRNNQSVMAYNQLAKKYSELEQNFSKEVHEWVLKTEKTIKEQSPDQLEMMVNQFKEQISFIVTTQEKKMLSELQNICQILTGLVPLIEGFQEHFINIVQNLKKKLETSSIESCKQTIRIKNDLYKIQNMHETCIKAIEKKVSSICKANKKEVSHAEEFDNLWCEIASDLNVIKLPERDIEREMLDTLTKEMCSRGSSVNEKLHCIKCLPEKEQVTDTVGYSKFKLFKTSILEKCSNYLRKAVHIDHDYDETYCRELLNIVTASCAHDDAKDLHITAETELELMLSALGSAVGEFKQMHNDFIQNNDPYYHFDQQKQKYSDMFNKIFSEKIEGQKCGKQCFEHYLKPALVDHIYKTYIKEIVNILSSIDFSTYTFCFFQYTILEQMLEESDFHQYLEYCRNYENYSKKRLLKLILKNRITCQLHYETLFSVTKKMRECLKDEEILQSRNAQEFLQCVSDKLKNELDISQNEVKDVFQTFPNIKEFVACVEKSLKDTEDEIRSEIESPDNKSLFSKATLDHLDEVFKNMPRCKTQCQFCKASCDVEDIGHKVHSSLVHQPEGLGGKISATTEMFDNETCSTNTAGNRSLTSSVTDGNSVSPKDYQTYYPEWFTATNLSTEASDYWKYVLKEFDEQFAEAFKVQPSAYPKEWNKITKEQARVSLRAAFHIQNK